MKYLILSSLIVIFFVSCIPSREMTDFHSMGTEFSIDLPTSYSIIESNEDRLYLETNTHGYIKWVEIRQVYFGDFATINSQYNDSRDVPILNLLSMPNVITKRDNGTYQFAKRIAENTFFVFVTNDFFTHKEIKRVYDSLKQNSEYASDMTAIGPIKFGITKQEYYKQKEKLYRDLPKIGEYEVGTIYSKFVDGKLAAVQLISKNMVTFTPYFNLELVDLYNEKYVKLGHQDYYRLYVGGSKTIRVTKVSDKIEKERRINSSGVDVTFDDDDFRDWAFEGYIQNTSIERSRTSFGEDIPLYRNSNGELVEATNNYVSIYIENSAVMDIERRNDQIAAEAQLIQDRTLEEEKRQKLIDAI